MGGVLLVVASKELGGASCGEKEAGSGFIFPGGSGRTGDLK